jgi:3-methyladenine DNA glycosylase AlkD
MVGRVADAADPTAPDPNAPDPTAPAVTAPALTTAAGWEAELRRLGSVERAVQEKAYLKSNAEFAGVPVPVMRSLVRSWRAARIAGGGPGHAEVTGLARALWASPLYECRQCVVILLERMAPLLTPGDIDLVEEFLRTSGTWALVDGLAANVAGDLVERYPQLTARLDQWAADADFWVRRSALLALLPPLRRGGGDFGRFAGYADAMLGEREFFIRKAIGWVLRETAKRRPDLVASWLGPRVHRASGVTVREAVKPMPSALRDELLARHRDKRPIRCEHVETVIIE